MKLRALFLSLFLAVPLMGISLQAENADFKSAKGYANHDERYVSHFAFVGQNVPDSSKGQTFLSKHIPKAINTIGRIIVHDIVGISQGHWLDAFTRAMRGPLTTSHNFIDRFLRSSISPHAP